VQSERHLALQIVDCHFSIREIIARFDQPIGRAGVGSKGRKNLEQIPSEGLADGMVEWPI
jgi:hypothetical protein